MWCRFSWVLALTLFVGTATAQPATGAEATEQHAALARSLFDQGMDAMRQGECEGNPIQDEAACARAAEAFRKVVELSPESLGALRNLALVEANRGRLATSVALWRDLAERAAATANSKYTGWAERATQAAKELATRVPRVRLEFGSRRPDTLTIDEVSVPSGVDTLELDPGDHVVVAKAAGAGDVVQSFTIAENETLPLAITFQALAPEDPERSQAPQQLEDNPRKRKRTGPLVLAGVGVGFGLASLGVGYAAWRERKDACGSTDHCDPDGLDRTLRFARASNALMAVGGAFVAGAIVWSLVKPRNPKTAFSLQILPTPGARVTTSW